MFYYKDKNRTLKGIYLIDFKTIPFTIDSDFKLNISKKIKPNFNKATQLLIGPAPLPIRDSIGFFV